MLRTRQPVILVEKATWWSQFQAMQPWRLSGMEMRLEMEKLCMNVQYNLCRELSTFEPGKASEWIDGNERKEVEE